MSHKGSNIIRKYTVAEARQDLVQCDLCCSWGIPSHWITQEDEKIIKENRLYILMDYYVEPELCKRITHVQLSTMVPLCDECRLSTQKK